MRETEERAGEREPTRSSPRRGERKENRTKSQSRSPFILISLLLIRFYWAKTSKTLAPNSAKTIRNERSELMNSQGRIMIFLFLSFPRKLGGDGTQTVWELQSGKAPKKPETGRSNCIKVCCRGEVIVNMFAIRFPTMSRRRPRAISVAIEFIDSQIPASLPRLRRCHRHAPHFSLSRSLPPINK